MTEEAEWARNSTPPGAWEQVANELRTNPVGTEVQIWWYGPRTSPNGAWMRDKCRRLGFDEINISHVVSEEGEKQTFISIPGAGRA